MKTFRECEFDISTAYHRDRPAGIRRTGPRTAIFKSGKGTGDVGGKAFSSLPALASPHASSRKHFTVGRYINRGQTFYSQHDAKFLERLSLLAGQGSERPVLPGEGCASGGQNCLLGPFTMYHLATDMKVL